MRSTKSSFIHRAISTWMCGVFTFSSLGFPQMAEANLWKDRREARLAMLMPALPATVSAVSPRIESTLTGSKQKKLRSVSAQLPTAFGTIRSVHNDSNSDAPILVYIQDVHQNFE